MTKKQVFEYFFNRLVNGYRSVMGKNPEGLDLIKIKQEARQKLIDQNKVIEFPQKRSFGEEVDQMIKKGEVNIGAADKTPPYKPSKSQSDFEIQTRIESDNAKAIEAFKKRNPKDDMATGGRAGYYGGGQAMVGEDLSEIGHGSDALMARNMQIAPGGQATTSTGLNYLLGQDNDTARVPYNEGKKVEGPNPKVLELMLNEKMSYPDALKELKIREKQQPYIDQRYNMGPRPILEAAEGGRIGYNEGGPARQNFAMGKRAFLKLMGGVGAGIAGLKSGLLGLGKKEAAKEVVKEVAKSSGGTVPPYFLNLVKKIKNLGDDAPRLAVKDREKITTYKDYTLTEDVVTGEKTIQRMKVLDDDSASYYGQPLTEETYMSYKPGKGLADETTKGKTIPDEYDEGTALLRSDRGNAGEIVEESATISDDVIEEGTKFEDNLSDFGKADGGRIGYRKGDIVTKGIPALLDLIKNKFGKKAITNADKLKTPQKTLDIEMFKKFETNNPKLSEVDEDLLIRGKELDLDPELMKTTYKSFIEDKGGIGSLKEFHADFVKETGKNVPIDNLRQAWRMKRSYPFNTPAVDKSGKYIGGEATQKMYPESKKFLVEESAESFMKPKVKKTTKREFIDVPPMPKGFKLSREKLEKNYPELDEDMIDQIMDLDKEMQGTVLTMLKNRRQNPAAYDKLLETKGDTLDFQGAFDEVTRKSNNADGGRVSLSGGGLAGMLGE